MSKEISETAFASQIESLLKIYHWHWYHARPARIKVKGGETYRTAMSGHKGLPDYIAVRNGRLLFFELKDQYSKTSPEQQEWLDRLSEVPVVEIYLWRPIDIEDVSQILR